MRRLVRPTLFALVRLCLFFAVTGLTVGVISGISDNKFSFDFFLFDFKVWVLFESDHWFISYNNLTTGSQSFMSTSVEPVNTIWNQLGVKLESHRLGYEISVKHWVPLTLSVVSFVILKLACRNRPLKIAEQRDD